MIYLLNYRHSNSEPLKSITQLPKEKAFILANKLYIENPCRAHNRFGSDFEEYYKNRIEMEKWLYNKFISLGGKPKIKNPLYFSLQHSENLYTNFNEGKIVKIKLDDIPSSVVSFTFDDSMAMFYSSDPINLFTKSQLFEFISIHNNCIDSFLNSIHPQCIYIEAQLWTDIF